MKKFYTIFCLVLIVAIVGCDDDPQVNPQGFTELTVDLNGSWKIDQVLQNGIDITNALDFQSFALDLNYDGTSPSSFSLAGKSPFVTNSSDGSWSFDDPTYPTAIIFSDGTSADIDSSILPTGTTQLTLNVTLGCDKTMYQYKLSK